jgi:DHHC palmitoyltransferase
MELNVLFITSLMFFQHEPPEQFYTTASGEDFTKRSGRRTLLRQISACITAVCCARPEVDSKTSYYVDTFNDEPWECTFGTSDQDGVWVNCGDKVGQIMSSMVWILISYSVVTVSLLAHNQDLPNSIAMIYGTICALALASHAKTTFTDPGSIPEAAVPRAILFKHGITTHAMCSHCQTYKPPDSHHCRICNRCISRMDHHCPWMNNCVGAANFSKCSAGILIRIRT